MGLTLHSALTGNCWTSASATDIRISCCTGNAQTHSSERDGIGEKVKNSSPAHLTSSLSLPLPGTQFLLCTRNGEEDAL
jgi:hypothetical protein